MSYPSDETIRMLHNVRDYAYTIWVRSQWLMTDVDIIQQRPDWETKAEEDIEAALEKVKEARIFLERALQRLKEKPVEPRQEG